MLKPNFEDLMKEAEANQLAQKKFQDDLVNSLDYVGDRLDCILFLLAALYERYYRRNIVDVDIVDTALKNTFSNIAIVEEVKND